MKDLDFLLYNLSRSVFYLKPAQIEGLRTWVDGNNNTPPLDIEHLCTLVELNPEQRLRFQKLCKEENKETVISHLDRAKISIITLFDDRYPATLSQIPDPPIVLYHRGNINLINSCINIGFVGSRRATSYGVQATDKLISGIEHPSINIVSGLAYGIDSAAHISAMKHKLATTAVLGSGLAEEAIYPKANYRLACEIVSSGGLLISEYPPETLAMKHQFIARNRIIAALSRAVIIIEAALQSGALITADFCADYNRSLFAVPGSIFSSSSIGTNKLLSQGAQVAWSVEPILQELGIYPTIAAPATQELTKPQALVLECIQREPIGLDDLACETQLESPTLLGALTELEIRQLIFQPHPQIYSMK